MRALVAIMGAALRLTHVAVTMAGAAHTATLQPAVGKAASKPAMDTGSVVNLMSAHAWRAGVVRSAPKSPVTKSVLHMVHVKNQGSVSAARGTLGSHALTQYAIATMGGPVSLRTAVSAHRSGLVTIVIFQNVKGSPPQREHALNMVIVGIQENVPATRDGSDRSARPQFAMA